MMRLPQASKHDRPLAPSEEDGFMLLAVIVLVFLVLLALTVAAPRIAMNLKREKEVESAHRANQYVRGIRMYYKKFGHYPGSVDQLEKSNNQRFLRQKYLDPLTGKDDWRLIHVGENKTKVKGFFGEDLPGLPGGLGAAAGLGSGSGGTTGGTGSGSSFNNSGIGGSGGNGLSGGSNSPGNNSSGSSGAGSNSGFGSSGTSGSSGSTPGSGIASKDAADATGSGGPIMGIGSSKSGEAILTVNEQTTYQDWEFLYDPRIEQLYAKANLLGGGASTSGGLGSASGLQSGGGNGTPGFGSAPDPKTPTPQQ